MENITITMNNNGDLICSDPNGGYIEELRARQLVISVNSFFRSSVISYFTVSFEPYGLGKKIVTDNIYKSENIGEVAYDPVNGTITCPIYDYISVSPKVSIQIDGYETDENSDVCAIYKSGVLDLHFSESLVGERIVPDMTNAEQKLSERISQMIDDEFDSIVISTDDIANGAVTSAKIGNKEVKTANIDDLAVTRAKIADSAINTSKLNNNAVSSDKINGRAVTLGKIAENAVTNYELADGAVKESNIASSQVSNSKISSGAVTSGKIYSGNDHTQRIQPSNIADGAIREAQLYSQVVSTSKIKDKAVTLNKLANDAKAYYQPFGVLSKKGINFISYSHTNGSPHKINTQEEYIYNCTHGYNSIKGDMRLTSDGKIIMCHDAGFTFDQNGKITTYDGDNCTLIHDMTYEECMAKQYFGGSYVCDFETYIGICKKYGKFAIFDLRYEYVEDTIAEMLRVIKKYQMENNCVVACANITPATAVRNADQNITIAFTIGRSDATGDHGAKYYIDRAAVLGNVICFGFDFPLGGDNGARNGVLALDSTFDDGDGNVVTAPEYANKLGMPYYECVVETNTETYDIDGVQTELNVIDECIKRGVTGFTTEDVAPDFAREKLSQFVSDSTHRTVTDAEKTSWNSVTSAEESSLPFALTDSNGNSILTIDENGNIRTMSFSSKNSPKIPITSIGGKCLASTNTDGVYQWIEIPNIPLTSTPGKLLSSTENEGVYQWVDLPSKAPTLKVPWIIEQHRGYSSTTVAENTMAAFKRTWLNGADMIELDARLSADNVYVCCHDPSITVGGVTYVIAETNADVLTNLVLSTDSEYGDCKIPTVEEVLKFCAHTDMICNLDCKAINPETMAKLVNKCGMSGRVLYANTDDNSNDITNALGILQYDKHASFLFQLISGAISKWETGLTNHPEVFERSWCWKDKAHTDANVIANAHAKGLKFLLNYASTDNIQDVFALQPDCIEFADETNFKPICDEYLESLNF